MSDSDEEVLDAVPEEEEEQGLDVPEVVTKYKAAADVANRALAAAITACKPGTTIVSVCTSTDAFITEELGKIYKKQEKTAKGEMAHVEKGVAFPTCISVNSCVCHFSPADGDATVLNEGDLVKIDLGCHISGYIAVVAHSLVLQEMAAPVTGRAADVLSAVHFGGEALLRLVKPGRRSGEIAAYLAKIAEAFKCTVVEGVLTHQMKRFVIDANRAILAKPTPDAKTEDFEFEENEVYACDVVMSTGEGKPRVLDEKQCQVYKRNLASKYHLKMKAARTLLSEVNKKFPSMPFTLRSLEDKKARLGLTECMGHELLTPYPVLHEKAGELVGHLKFTVLCLPNGNDRITGMPLQALEPAGALPESPAAGGAADALDVRGLLAQSIKSDKGRSKNAKKKAKKEAAAAGGAGPAKMAE